MIGLIYLLSVLGIAIAFTNHRLEPEGMILGGSDADYGRYPHQVSIRKYGEHNCGGSIISEFIILTAAHCVYGEDASSMTIMVGTTNRLHSTRREYQALYFEYHEDFNSYTVVNDIAVIKVARPIRFDELVHPIKLAKTRPEPAEKLRLSGWGKTSADYIFGSGEEDLQDIELTNLALEECILQFGSRMVTIGNGHICTLPTMGKGACFGDSGGPLINYKDEIVGIPSWIVRPCASGHPDVYTSVAFYNDWVQQFLENTT